MPHSCNTATSGRTTGTPSTTQGGTAASERCRWTVARHDVTGLCPRPTPRPTIRWRGSIRNGSIPQNAAAEVWDTTALGPAESTAAMARERSVHWAPFARTTFPSIAMRWRRSMARRVTQRDATSDSWARLATPCWRAVNS